MKIYYNKFVEGDNMKKSKIIGWVINALLAACLISSVFVAPTPEVFATIVAGLTLTGIAQSYFTIIVPTEKYEKKQKILKNAHVTENSIEPEKVFEQLHSKLNTTTSQDNHKYYTQKNEAKNEQIINEENSLER